MKFAIFTKADKDLYRQEELVLKECSLYNFVKDEEHPDVVFVLGGDGTLLKAVHRYIDILDQVKFVGIRCGTLGFFYDFNEGDIVNAVKLVNDNDYIIDSHHLLECELKDKKVYALNEIRIENPFHALEIKVNIDDEPFEVFNGNGLLVCTPLGSTAYNRSLGGAILAHRVDAIELSEISSIQSRLYNSLNSSLILPSDSHITLLGSFEGSVLGYDNKYLECGGISSINIKKSDKVVNFIYDKKHSDIKAIKRSFIK